MAFFPRIIISGGNEALHAANVPFEAHALRFRSVGGVKNAAAL